MQVEGDLVQLHVELAPPDLVDRRLRPGGAALAERGDGLEREQLVRLGAHPRVDDAVAQVRAASPSRGSRSSSRSAVAMKRPGERSVRPALGAGGGHRHRPALVHLAEHHAAGQRVVGEEGLLEEHLGEALVAVEPAEAAHGDAGRVERDEQVAQALVPLRRRVGAEQPEQVRAERAAGRPGLLPVEHPAAVDAPRLAAHRRPGRCRRSAPTTPGTRGPRRPPCAGGCGPAARRCRTRTRWGPAGRCRSASPAAVRRPGSTPPRTAATPTATRPARRRPRATTPPPTGRRTAAAPRAGAPRTPPACRPTAAHPPHSARHASRLLGEPRPRLLPERDLRVRPAQIHARSLRLWAITSRMRREGDTDVVMRASSGSRWPRSRCGRGARRRWGARRSRR